jgi:transketolase
VSGGAAVTAPPTLGAAAPTRDAYGHALLELGRTRPDVVVLEADLARSTRTEWFAREFPDRFVNMGIAEANMIGTAAGLAATGLVPFATTYAIFLGRAYDQLRQCLGYAGANVKVVATHAGLAAANDGGSHQGVEDITLLRLLPGVTVLSPADYWQTYAAVLAAADLDGPVYLRLQKEDVPAVYGPGVDFEVGRVDVLREGEDVLVLATGSLVAEATKAAETLALHGIDCAVLNVSTIKPLDVDTLAAWARLCGCAVTAEEHLAAGGLFAAVSEALARHVPIPIEPVALDDRLGQSGGWRELLDHYRLNAVGIEYAVRQVLGRRPR